MPFTVDQLGFLGLHLGVAIPPEFVENKKRAEEFKRRREEVATGAGGKPADWRLKAEFDGALERAVDAAGQKQFNAAFKALDEAGQLLLQPDAPPPSPPPPAPAAPPMPAPAAAAPAAAPEEEDFLEKWKLAKQAWLESVEKVDGQLDKARKQMLALGNPDFKIIADRGLPALTENHKTPVTVALLELEKADGPGRKDAALKAGAAIDAFRQHLGSSHLIKALDEHSATAFGVPITLRIVLGKGLNALEQALQPLTAGAAAARPESN